MEKYRHKKRGTTYNILGRGKIQSENWAEIGRFDSSLQRFEHDMVDMREVVVYQCIEDDSIWVRPLKEFFDGRFEKVEE